MLQIDEKQLQVCSCSFNLFLGNASLPLRFKDARYFIEWKIKNKQSGTRSTQKVINDLGYVELQQRLKLHTEILRNIRTKKFLKKFGQLTLFLISSKQPERPKIVGSTLIELHEVLNQNKHSQMKWARLSLSPFDVDMQFKCIAAECRTSSILQANLDAALVVRQSFMTKPGLVQGQSSGNDQKLFLKKKITKEFYQQDDNLSKGDCSILRPELEEVLAIHESPIQSNSSSLGHSQSILQSVAFEGEPNLDLQNSLRIQNSSSKDLKQLIKENRNLQKLLFVVNNERKIEVETYEVQLREMARQLSIKQAEILKLTETHKSGSIRVGELLDSATYNLDHFNTIKIQNGMLNEQLSIQKQYNIQLDQNYKRLEIRLQMVKDWEHQRNFLIQKIKQVEEDNEHYQLKYFDLQNKKYIRQEQLLNSIKSMGEKIKQLEDELRRRDKIIELYQQKVRQFEEQIQFMQQEVVSRVDYSAASEVPTALEQGWRGKNKDGLKPTSSRDHNHIIIEEDGLKGIKQEQQQESFISNAAQKQIATAAELPGDLFSEADFYRKMASNIQSQLDQLHLLYRQKDRVLLHERATSKGLYEQLQRLRFQFVYEVSKVTSQLNNKVIQIRQLKEENTLLRQRDIRLYGEKVEELEQKLSWLQQQRLEYFDKCCRLEQEKFNLININKEKQDIYFSIIKNQHHIQSKDEDLLSIHLGKIIRFMLNNENKYIPTLKKFGIAHYSIESLSQQPHSDSKYALEPNNQSHILARYTLDNNPCDSDKLNSIASQQDLLIESIARETPEKTSSRDPSSLLNQLLGDLSELKNERQKGVSFLRQMATRSQLSFKKPQKVSPLFQLLKKNIISWCQQSIRGQLLRTVKNIQMKLSSNIRSEWQV